MQNFEKLLDYSIKEAVYFLQEYITHIFQDPISEKSNDFFTNFTQILFMIFGSENQPGWLEKSYKLYSETDPKKNFALYSQAESDLKMLINLLSPSRSKPQANFFSLIMENFTNSRYALNEINLPAHTQYLIMSKSYNHPTIKEYDLLFGALGGSKGATKDIFELVLSPYEFYLFVFIFSMKKFKTFVIEPKVPEDCSKNDYVIGLVKNPYLILLRKYFDYFCNENYSTFTSKSCFKKILFLMEDYFINDIIFGSPIFTKSTVTTTTLTPGTKLSSPSLIKPEYRYDVTRKIPCPHIFYALAIALHYLYKILNPFGDYSNNHCMLYLSKNIDEARLKYSKLFYHYLLTCLKSWNKDLNNPSSLFDFGILWFAYIKPWEVIYFFMHIYDVGYIIMASTNKLVISLSFFLNKKNFFRYFDYFDASLLVILNVKAYNNKIYLIIQFIDLSTKRNR